MDSYKTMYAVIGTGEVYAFGFVPWKGLRIGYPFASGVCVYRVIILGIIRILLPLPF